MARYRCTACGNLTRFEVVVNRRIRYYHHQTISGEMAPENEELLAEAVETVVCIWCGHGRGVDDITEPATEPASPSG